MALSDAQKDVLLRRMNVWNSKNPVDLIWRKHFKIPFGSKAHLEADMFDQYIWFEEFKMLQDLENKIQAREEGVKGIVKGHVMANTIDLGGDTVSDIPMTEEEIDAEFEQLGKEESDKKGKTKK